MKYMKLYNTFNEKLGVALSSTYYAERLTHICLDNVYEFVNSDLNKQNITLTLNYNDVKNLVEDWTEYTKFPVSEIKVLLSLNKYNLKKIGSVKPYRVGGFAPIFSDDDDPETSKITNPIKMNVDHSLSLYLGINIFIGDTFKRSEHWKMIFDKTESVLLHEFNHLYEMYNRKMRGSKGLDTSLTHASIGPNVMRTPKKIWDYWQSNFTDLIYMSEPHEINAATQEAYSIVKNMDYEEFKNHKIFIDAKSMQNFNYVDFLKNFDKIVSDHNPEYVGDITDNLIKIFIREYKKLILSQEETPYIKPSTLDKMTTEDFFKFFQKKINKGGEKLIKRLTRLYSL